MNGLTIDGNTFSFEEVMITDFIEKGEILSGKNSGRRQDFNMYIEYGGTYYNYSFVINKRPGCSVNRWDDLFSILTDPINDHNIILPHNQSLWEVHAYISSASRKLNNIKNGYDWGNITVEFISMKPQRLA